MIKQVTFQTNGYVVEADILDETPMGKWVAHSDSEFYGTLEVLSMTVVDLRTDSEVAESIVGVTEVLSWYEAHKETQVTDAQLNFLEEDY